MLVEMLSPTIVPAAARSPLSAALLALACATTTAGCGDDDEPGPGDETGPRVSFKVMTRNLYLGSDLFTVVGATTPEEVPERARAFWETVQKSDPRGRLLRMAAEIAAEKPDLISLQEVERFATQTPSNFDLAAPTPPDANEVAFDFLTILQEELTRLGMRYQAFETALTDAELPSAVAGQAGRMDVRMTDRDVILVREGLATSDVARKIFTAHVPLRIGGATGVPVKVLRGYTRVNVTVEGVPLTFVASHLEVGGQAAPIQQDQARELVADLKALPGTLVVAGDFNSSADGRGTTSYKQLTSILVDGWVRPQPTLAGPTCCSDLDSSPFDASSRIDLILHRGPLRAEAAAIVGTDPAGRTPAGLWPSDHAGVIMTLSAPR